MGVGTDAVSSSQLAPHALAEADGARVVLVNGQIAEHLSDTSQVPDGVFLGDVATAPEEIASRLVSPGVSAGTANNAHVRFRCLHVH